MFSATVRTASFRRWAASGFHCTTKGETREGHRKAVAGNGVAREKVARTEVDRRGVARNGVAVMLALAGLMAAIAVAFTGAAFAFTDAAFARVSPHNTWQAMFDLQPGVTYTYTLMHQTTGRGSGFPPGPGHAPGASANAGAGFGPGRSGGRPVRGELNLWRSGGANDEVRFWLTFDDVRINGTAPNDPQAVAGAVLVAALTNPTPVSYDGIRLLATVFHWTNWRDLFAGSTFRNGVVWEVLQHPPHRFTARQQGVFGPYYGELTRGRDPVLQLTIDLAKPLPLEIVAIDGRSRYVAELVQEPIRGPRR